MATNRKTDMEDLIGTALLEISFLAPPKTYLLRLDLVDLLEDILVGMSS